MCGSIKLQNTHSNPEKEGQSWKHHTSCFQTTLQSYSNKHILILGYKYKHRPMEEDPGPEINSQIYGELIFDKETRILNWEKIKFGNIT